jgi:HEAT repeat protein
MIIRAAAAGITAVVVVTGTAWAQATVAAKSAPTQSVATLAGGWRLLADGDAARAARVASDLLTRDPRSSAVLSFAIEVAIARGGGAGALDVYERWLGSRTVEDPYAVRRIARALLRETATADTDRAVRLEAVEALLADGDTAAGALLPPSSSAAAAETAVRGSTGDRQSVDALIAQASQPGPARRVAVPALARTRDARAIQPLTDVLQDDDSVVRAAAAEALGELGATSAIPDLKPLLDDRFVYVRLAAAAALLKLKDLSGMPRLQELLRSEYPAIRVSAARAAAPQADAEWRQVVRDLTQDTDPEVRRQAAELIAPYDPALAKATIEPLLTDSNPAERQAAADTYVKVTTDFAVLRRFLRDADAGTRVRAADRVLELTR